MAQSTYSTSNQDMETHHEIEKMARRLTISPSKIKSAKYKVSITRNSVSIWQQDPIVAQLISPYLPPFELQKPFQLSSEVITGNRKNLNFNEPAIIWDESNNTIELHRIPGVPSNTQLKVHSNNKVFTISTANIDGRIFKECPSEYVDPKIQWYEHIRTTVRPNLASVQKQNAKSSVELHNLEISPNSITWKLTCEYRLTWPQLNEASAVARVSFDLNLLADTEIIQDISRDSSNFLNYESIQEADKKISGTRFNVNEYFESTHKQVTRWQPHREKIVIDDLMDATGNLFTNDELGKMIQEGLKIGVADLRLKFPELGRKLVLRTEQAILAPDITFIYRNNLYDIKISHNDTSELRHIKNNMKFSQKLSKVSELFKKFESMGMINNADNAFKDSVLALTINSLGESLGLSQNLAGFGMNQNWGNDLQSNMSLVFMGIPMEFISDKIEWKPHDLLSLKILYSEVIKDINKARNTYIPEVQTYPLSPVQFDSNDGNLSLAYQIKLILEFFEKTNHPKIVNFRDDHPHWREKISLIYADIYGI